MNFFIRNFYYTLIFTSFSFWGYTQISPGGVGNTNLTAWFRADDIPSGDITSWSTIYPNGSNTITLTEGGAPYPQLELTPSNSVSNYNRTLHFSNNSYAGLSATNLQGLSLSAPPNLLSNAYSGDQGSFFSAFYLPVPPSNNGHFLLYNNGNDALQFRNLTNKGRIAIGKLSSTSINASRDWVEDFKPNITSYRGNRSGSGTMYGYNKGALLPTPTIASQSSGNDGLYVGYASTIGTSAYNGYIHEFIFFNIDLDDLQMNKIHTYLAIKYGVTLDHSAGGTDGDYTSTNGITIWDASLAPEYHKDVIGIGRDDAEGLNQKQSHAFGDSIRIYISNLEAYNEMNNGSFQYDVSYVLMGHNTGELCNAISTSNEIPSGITTRIDQEYKVTKTNFNQTFNWDLIIDTCSGFSANINLTNLSLLVDNDGDFSDATVFDQTDGLTFSLSGNTITVSGISALHIPDNSTKYITLGYNQITYSIIPGPSICSGDNGFVIFNIENATGPVTINYTENGVSQTLSGVVDGDTLFISPQQTTDYEFNPISTVLNCCNSNNTILYTQIVYPLPVIQIDANATEICNGETVTLTASGADVYIWDPMVINGQSFPPDSSQYFVVTGQSTDGCNKSDSIYITVHPLPVLHLTADTLACDGDELMYTALGADTIVWSGDISNGTPFQATTGTWNYTVTGTDLYNCSSQLNITLQVFDQPIAYGMVSVTEGINPLEVSFENLSSNADSIWWDFDNGDGSYDPEICSTTYYSTGTYIVELTAFNGPCVSTWQESIVVFAGVPSVTLPNVFTPDNDGINDIYLINYENVVSMEGYISNRWGNVVFEFDTPDFEWTGDNLSNGTYFIIYRANGADGSEITGQGFIELLR